MHARAVAQDARGQAAWSLAFVLLIIVAVYFDTFSSIVATWYRVDAYHHGFLILPICIFLLWQQRHRLRNVEVMPSWAGVIILAALSLVWWLSEYAGIQVLKQYSVVAMVPAAVIAIYGWPTTSAIRFPLFYLLLAVPFGEFLLPYMVDFTAGFAVDALSALGIPVFRDGRYFYIPSGSFEVAEACGGLKYFISTFALALLYSYFLFEGTLKKALFVGFALLLSIVTNGIRATSVVLILHYTDLDIARGKDHEFVGWILFGMMLALLLWLGNRFADKKTDDSETRPAASRPSGMQPGIAIAVPCAVAALSLGAALTLLVTDDETASTYLASGLPAQVEGWDFAAPEDAEWRPRYMGYTRMLLGRYQNNGEAVDVALVQYATLRQGAEITSAINYVADPETWRLGNVIPISPGPAGLRASEVRGNAAQGSRLFWYWVDVNGVSFDSRLSIKIAEIRNMISGTPNISSAVILSTPISGNEEDSQKVLARFVAPFYEQLSACMANSASSQACVSERPDPKDS